MKFRAILAAGVVLAAGLSVIAAAPALARAKHKVQRQCIDRPHEFSWRGLFWSPAPQPNGCAPAVYAQGRFVGQDPDPNIRFQLHRDPRTGYYSDY
jgi:hypothetical protein